MSLKMVGSASVKTVFSSLLLSLLLISGYCGSFELQDGIMNREAMHVESSRAERMVVLLFIVIAIIRLLISIAKVHNILMPSWVISSWIWVILSSLVKNTCKKCRITYKKGYICT